MGKNVMGHKLKTIVRQVFLRKSKKSYEDQCKNPQRILKPVAESDAVIS